MFSNLATKLALKKAGLPTSIPTLDASTPKRSSTDPPEANNWPSWLSVRSLPLTVQPWLTPAPPPVPVAPAPELGHLAPRDRDRKLVLGDGRNVLVVFLRCVGCAFAQKTLLHLRDIASRSSPSDLHCIAISHSSSIATSKWLSLLGGAGRIEIIIDQDRVVYSAWGLGLASVWYMFNPSTQASGWRQDGWLGIKVVSTITRPGLGGKGKSLVQKEQEDKERERLEKERIENGGDGNGRMRRTGTGLMRRGTTASEPEETITPDGLSSAMGNKWQTAGAWAVNGRGVIIWGGQAKSADDLMDLYDGCRALGL